MAEKTTPIPSFVLRSFSASVNAVRFDPVDAQRLLTGTEDGSISLYDLEKRRPVLSIDKAHEATIFDINKSRKLDDQFLSFGKDGFLKLWNFSGECSWKLRTNQISFSNVEILDSTNFLIPIGESRSAVGRIDVRSPKPICQQFVPDDEKSEEFGMVMKISLIEDQFLVVAYENGSLNVFQISMGKQLDRFQITTDHEPITALDVFQNHCLCGTSKHHLVSLDFDSNQFRPTESFRQTELKNPGTSFIRCRPNDGKIVAVASWDSKVRIFRRETAKQLALMDFHRQQVHSIDFQFQTSRMACGSSDRTVSVWDIYNEKK